MTGGRTSARSSLAKPGGNVTGLSTLAPELEGKRLEGWRRVSQIPNRYGSSCLQRLKGERHQNHAESENDREPDQPHGHLGEGWLAGV
jgi:hypothetical protein